MKVAVWPTSSGVPWRRSAIPTIAIVSAAIILAPTGHAEPCVSPSGNDCGNPYFDPNAPNNAQFLAAVRATGISGNYHGLISGALNNVCPDLNGGKPYQNIVADLEKYSGYSQIQAHTYIAQAVSHYCPNDADKLS
jgi:Protein of unknown function (DUF732)